MDSNKKIANNLHKYFHQKEKINFGPCNEKQLTFKAIKYYKRNNSNSKTSYNQKSLQELQLEEDNQKKEKNEKHQHDWFNEELISVQLKLSKNCHKKEELNNLLSLQPLIPVEKGSTSTRRISPTVISDLPDELLKFGENDVSENIEVLNDLKKGTKKLSALKTKRNLTIKDEAQNINKNKTTQSMASSKNIKGPLYRFILPKRAISRTDLKKFNVVDVVHPVKYGFNVDKDSIRFDCNETFVRVRIPKTLKSAESIEGMLFAHIYSIDS